MTREEKSQVIQDLTTTLADTNTTSSNLNNGIFNTNIKINNPSIFLNQLYEILYINGEATNQNSFTSVPYSIVSKYSNNSYYLNGQLGSYYLDNTDSQSLSLNGNNLSISNGNSVLLNYFDGLYSSLTGVPTLLSNFTNDVGFVTNDTMNKSVDCSNIDGATSNLCTIIDTDTTYTAGNYLSLLANDFSLNITELRDNLDLVYLQSEVDGSITNELQDLSLNGNILNITDGTGVDLSSLITLNTDNQTLSYSNGNITISGGNSVNISGVDTTLSESEVINYINNTKLNISVNGMTAENYNTTHYVIKWQN